MGTNYELVNNYCIHCGRGERIHLGKSSMGWVFTLQYNNGQYYKNWEEMKIWLQSEHQKGNIIKDEYDNKKSLKDFIRLVETKQKREENRRHTSEYPDRTITDSEGYGFSNYEFS